MGLEISISAFETAEDLRGGIRELGFSITSVLVFLFAFLDVSPASCIAFGARSKTGSIGKGFCVIGVLVSIPLLSCQATPANQ